MNAIVVLRLLDVPWFPDNDAPWILRLMLLRYFVGRPRGSQSAPSAVPGPGARRPGAGALLLHR